MQEYFEGLICDPIVVSRQPSAGRRGSNLGGNCCQHGSTLTGLAGRQSSSSPSEAWPPTAIHGDVAALVLVVCNNKSWPALAHASIVNQYSVDAD